MLVLISMKFSYDDADNATPTDMNVIDWKGGNEWDSVSTGSTIMN